MGLTRAILDVAAPSPPRDPRLLVRRDDDKNIEYFIASSSSSPRLMEMCHQVRYLVFVKEQGFSEDGEVDSVDPECIHIAAYDSTGKEYIGTGRAYYCAKEGAWKLGRLAVVKSRRGSGVGHGLMDAIEQRIVSETTGNGAPAKVVLTAQLHATKFYERCGYSVMAHRGVYVEEGVDHLWMAKDL